MLSYILFAILFSSYSLCQTTDFTYLRKSHIAQSLSDSQVAYLASLTDISHINKTLDNICIPRVVGTEEHDKVHNYIVSQLSSMKWNVEVDSFRDKTPIFGVLTFRNIIATLNPKAERYLVLACHYDSKYFADFEFVGATDSAVPCAMMLNLAYVMRKELEGERDLDLKLIFFDGEEAFKTWDSTDSIYGARHLASKYSLTTELARSGQEISHLDRLDMMILLDLIGTPNPSFYSHFRKTSKWHLELVEAQRRLMMLKYLRPTANYFKDMEDNAHIEDDHIPFLARGVPILHVIPIPFPEYWHTVNDDRNSIDMRTIESINKILRVFVAEYLHLSVNS